MKKQVKRVVVMLLTAAMLVTSLVGCNRGAAYDYTDVLTSYREMLSAVQNGDALETPKGEVETLIYEIGQICEPEKMGYALKDINGDGTDELVLMSENYEPYALFTAKKGKPVLLWSWVNDFKLSNGAIDHYGYIYGYENWDPNTEGWCEKVMYIGKDGELKKGRRGYSHCALCF